MQASLPIILPYVEPYLTCPASSLPGGVVPSGPHGQGLGDISAHLDELENEADPNTITDAYGQGSLSGPASRADQLSSAHSTQDQDSSGDIAANGDGVRSWP